MAAALFPIHQFFDNAGAPLNGGLIYTYQAGSTTPKTAYSDADLTIPQTNPIVLDAYGRPATPIWCSGETKLVIKTSVGVQINPVFDNFNKTVSGFGGYSTKNDGVLTKSANYSIVAADDGKVIVATSGSWTLSTAVVAATMTDGFFVNFYNAGSGYITFDPIGAETVNGATTLVLGPTEGGTLFCDGANWRAVIGSSGWVKLASGAVSSPVGTVDINGFLASYSAIKVTWANLRPDTDNTSLWARTSTDGGATFDAGASDYHYGGQGITELAGTGVFGSAGDSKLVLSQAGLGNAAAAFCSGEIVLWHPMVNTKTQGWANLARVSASGLHVTDYCGLLRNLSQQVNGLRFLMSAGNIATMNYIVSGLKI